jgi:hypothetical protein
MERKPLSHREVLGLSPHIPTLGAAAEMAAGEGEGECALHVAKSAKELHLQMFVTMLPLQSSPAATKLLSLRRLIDEHVPTGVVPDGWSFIMDEEDRVTRKQEHKFTLATLGGDGRKVLIAPPRKPRATGLPSPALSQPVVAVSLGDPLATAGISAVQLLQAQDAEVRRRERDVAAKNDDLLSNLDRAPAPLKYMLKGAGGRTVAETEAYLEEEMEGVKKEPVAVTVWENERRTILPHFLTAGERGFSSVNLGFTERKQWSDVAGNPKEMDDPTLLPEGWEWQGDWTVMLARENDQNGKPPHPDGWQYANTWGYPPMNVDSKDTHVRRRRWARVRVPTEQAEVARAKNIQLRLKEAEKVTAERRQAQLQYAVLDRQVAEALKQQQQQKTANMSSSLSRPFKEGYLHKLGSFRRNWSKRWFVLNEGTLSYYGSESDLIPKKQLALNEACKFGASDEVVKDKVCFQIATWGITLSLYAETDQEMEEWKAFVQAHVDGTKEILLRAPQPIMRGPLHKRGEWGKWTRRWFVVEGSKLMYFASPDGQRENLVPLGDFDLRGATLKQSLTTTLGRPDVVRLDGIQQLAADTWSDETITTIQSAVEFVSAGREPSLCFSLECRERVTGRLRTLNLSAENTPEFDEWTKWLSLKIMEAPPTAKFAEKPMEVSIGDGLAADSPLQEFVLERGAIHSVSVTADRTSGDSKYISMYSDEAKAYFHVTVVQQDPVSKAPQVRWVVQQPYTRFEELHKFFESGDPKIAADLRRHLPTDWPQHPSRANHEDCAAQLQRYYEAALAPADRNFGQLVELAKVLSPAVGKLVKMEGRLNVRRRLHRLPAPAPRWCRVEMHPRSWNECQQAAKAAATAADEARKRSEYEEACGLFGRAAALAAAHSTSSMGDSAGDGDDGDDALAADSISAETLQRQADEMYESARNLNAQFTWRGGGVNGEVPLGPCFSWSVGPEPEAVSVGPERESDSAAFDGVRVSRGVPDAQWPIDQFRLDSAFVRTEPSNVHEIELIDTASQGTRVRMTAPTEKVWELWHACFRLVCCGHLNHTVRQACFTIAPRGESITQRHVHVEKVADPYDHSGPVTHLGLLCPDYTRIRHRRGSESGIGQLATSDSPPIQRRRRPSTDERYIAQLRDGMVVSDGPAPQSRLTPDMRMTIAGPKGFDSIRPPLIHSGETIVIDFGSYSTKCGRAQDCFPVAIDESCDTIIDEDLQMRPRLVRRKVRRD